MFKNIVYGMCCIALLFGAAAFEDVTGMTDTTQTSSIRQRRRSIPVTKREVRAIGEKIGQLEQTSASSTKKRSHTLPVTKSEKEEVMRILRKDDFLRISPKQAAEIKAISFEGIEIDSELVAHFYSAMYHHIDSLSFKNCTLAEGCYFSDLFDSEYPVINLAIIGSNLSIKDASTVLFLINPYLVRKINFSGNNFMNEEEFEQDVLKRRISGVMSLDALILKGNGFSSPFVNKLETSGIAGVVSF